MVFAIKLIGKNLPSSSNNETAKKNEKRLSEISNRSVEISVFQKELNKLEAIGRAHV